MQIIIILIAKYLILVIPILLAYYVWTHDNKRLAMIESLMFLSVSVIAWVCSHFLKSIFKIPRPHIAIDSVSVSDSLYSFPSGHVTFFFAIATALYFYHRKLAYAVALFGLAVGLARVDIGYHYPIDIVGGMVLGIVVGYAGHKVYKKLAKSNL